MNRRAKLVLALVGLVVALIAGLSAIIETDGEAIERVTNACRLGMLDGDVEAILDHVTDDAVYVRQKRTRSLATEVRERVERLRKRVGNITLSLRSIEVDGDDAHATWQVFVRMRPGEEFPMGRFDVRVGYRREPSDWKVTRVELSTP
jgi:ketosteroid isomerase-like protein